MSHLSRVSPSRPPVILAPLACAVALSQASRPVGAAHPHEPAGFTRFAEHSFSAAPASGPPGVCSGTGVIDGCWFIFSSGGNLTGVRAPGAPFSAPGVLQFRYPTGLAPGSGPGILQGWDTGSETNSTQFSGVYESGWVRIPSADFEMQQIGVKVLGYVGVGGAGTLVPNQVYFLAYNPTGVTEAQSSLKVSMVEQSVQDRRLDPNLVTSPTFTCGTWHHYEYVMTLNTPGSADGTFKMWWNGRLISSYSDVIYRTTTYPSGFYGRRWDPVWGGTGGPNRSRDDFLQIDHLYLSGR